MGSLIDALQGEPSICLDACTLIYWFENHPQYAVMLEPVFAGMESGTLSAACSHLALLELVVKPLQGGRRDLAEQLRANLLNSRGLRVLPLDEQVAMTAARIRAGTSRKVGTPDAIHLATGLVAGSGVLVTNDTRIPSIDGLRVVQLDDVLRSP